MEFLHVTVSVGGKFLDNWTTGVVREEMEGEGVEKKRKKLGQQRGSCLVGKPGLLERDTADKRHLHMTLRALPCDVYCRC